MDSNCLKNMSFIDTKWNKIKFPDAITWEYDFSEDVQMRINSVKTVFWEINI